MGKPVLNVELTEDELLAIEKALEHANANTKDMRVLLEVFRVPEIAHGARSAWNKAGRALREITIARKTDPEKWD